MMNSRMACSAERLEVVHRIVARAPIAAPSGSAAVEMMDSEVFFHSAPLAGVIVSFQCLDPVSAEVKIVAGLSDIPIEPFFWHIRHGAAHLFRSFCRGACRAVYFRPAVVDVRLAANGARITPADNTGTCFAAILDKAISVVSGSHKRPARDADLLASTRGFVDQITFHADAFTKSIARFAVCFERARSAALCIGGPLHHLCAAAGTDDIPIRSRCHEAFYGRRWGIV